MNLLYTGIGASDLALFVVRLVVGAFFMLAGWNKLFHPVRRTSMHNKMRELNIPFPNFNAVFVPIVETVAGAMLVLGTLSVAAALALATICLVACGAEGIERIESWSPVNRKDWLATALYLPEVLYLALLVAVVVAGPGRYSIDRVLFF